MKKPIWQLCIVLSLFIALGSVYAQTDCNGIDRPIVFAGLDWDSAQANNAIAGHILEAGFGCTTEDIPGSTVPLVQGLVRGDIDINMEIWFNTAPDTWHEAVETGEVLDLGLNMAAQELSFLVPRYLVEGDAERGIEALAPGLRSIEDLPEHAALFKDPEEPDKGRYYNCIIGWQCELVNNNKFKAYDLEGVFTNFRPGTAAALASSLAAAYEKGEPWLGYYWGPTWVLGEYDMIALEEPAYSDECWAGDQGCAFPTSIVNVSVSREFADNASQEMLDFLEAFELDSVMVSRLLAFMRTNDAEASDAALEFLKNESDVWTSWVSEEVAERVLASLN
ncbi:MAG: ABC transporter substrate-binding protein [Trueperaceae bacterium]|nr:MAG: ABC transporter substrate-binding protein [Trueperaceae bacterium]